MDLMLKRILVAKAEQERLVKAKRST